MLLNGACGFDIRHHACIKQYGFKMHAAIGERLLKQVQRHVFALKHFINKQACRSASQPSTLPFSRRALPPEGFAT